MTTEVTTMIFTLDEEIHLPGCLGSLRWCNDVIVVDSFSSDRTVEIARQFGARVLQHKFTGFGDQRTWALDGGECRHEWVLILDADERVTPELAIELSEISRRADAHVGAYRVRRRFHMWGRWLRYSGLYPTWVVRFVRRGRVRYVNRGHAETQEVEGLVKDLANDLVDENLKGIEEWFERQNRYSSKDAEHELALEKAAPPWSGLFSADPLVRRAAVKGIGMRMPARPFVYFVYAYLFKGGFREGRDGLVFCMMRALYQGMVVAKKHDLRKRTAIGG